MDLGPDAPELVGSKSFWFSRALVRGTWTMARALAAIEARFPEASAVDVAFSRPLPLPPVANFVAVQQNRG